jgi:hypothetical protein
LVTLLDVIWKKGQGEKNLQMIWERKMLDDMRMIRVMQMKPERQMVEEDLRDRDKDGKITSGTSPMRDTTAVNISVSFGVRVVSFDADAVALEEVMAAKMDLCDCQPQNRQTTNRGKCTFGKSCYEFGSFEEDGNMIESV